MKIFLNIVYFLCLLFGIYFALLGIIAIIKKSIVVGLVYILLATVLIFAGIKLNKYLKKKISGKENQITMSSA